MNEAVDCELEALQETFDVTVTSNDEACHSISMRLQPYTGDEDIFVETGLRFSLDRFYPRSMPKFLFDSHKGLSDERLQVLRKATAEAAQEFVGEPVLMTMCMAAKDALSLMNFPEGAVQLPESLQHSAMQLLAVGVCLYRYFTAQQQNAGAAQPCLGST